MDGELNDYRDQIAASDVEVAKLTNKCQVCKKLMFFYLYSFEVFDNDVIKLLRV